MIAVHQSKFYRNLFSATLNDLREGADLSCSGRQAKVPKTSTAITERTF